jgi:SAM-dependent methyltransferase
MNDELRKYQFDPNAFERPSIEDAAAIILVDDDKTTQERWTLETEYLLKKIRKELKIDGSVIIDYGCGVGRIARELTLENCIVIGADTSPTMRRFAAEYVPKDNFVVLSPDVLIPLNIQADYGLAIWVLQHCLYVDKEIDIIYRTLKPGGKLFVLNTNARSVPTTETVWIHDFVEVRELLEKKFSHCKYLDLSDPPSLSSDPKFAFCAVYTK